MPNNPAIEAACVAFNGPTPWASFREDERENDRRCMAAAVRAYEPAAWSSDMSAAPRDMRIMVGVHETGETFIVRWMTSIEEGDGQWVISRSVGADAVAFVCRAPDCWRLPPALPPFDRRPDNTGLDDGPELHPARRRPAPKSPEDAARIRAQAWATRRAKHGGSGHG